MPVREYSSDKYVFMATSFGTVKKVSLDNFSRPRANGIIAVDLKEGNRLVEVALTDGKQDVILFSNGGKAVRFSESQVRATGRTACGVRGMRLKADQKVISLVVVQEGGTILTACENGYGKRTEVSEYPCINRGGQGVIAIRVSDRNGKVISAIQVYPGDEIMLINDQGHLVRTRVDEISVIGRATQGVRLINIAKDEKLIGIQRIEEDTQLPENAVVDIVQTDC